MLRDFQFQNPKVLLTTREVLDMPREITEGARTSAYKYLGLSYNKQSLIFINVRKISNEKDLDNTIVHELIHQRFPYLSHGKRFSEASQTRLDEESNFPPYQKRK